MLKKSKQKKVRKVLILISNIYPFHLAGQYKTGTTLARNLSEREIKVLVITNSPEHTSSFIEDKQSNLKYFIVPGDATLLTYFRHLSTIIRVAKTFDPDIIHGHGMSMTLLAAPLGRILRKPVIQTLCEVGQTFSLTSGSISVRTPMFIKYGLFFVDHVICSSNFVKKLLEEARISANKITVVPYGVEETWFSVNKSIILTLNSKTATILFWGDASFDRGIDTLLGAIPKVVERFPDAKFILSIRNYGHTYRKKINQFTKAYPIKLLKSMHYQRISEIVSSANIIVLPYNATTIYPPLTLVESLLVGGAVITTDVEANRELIGENMRGMLVEPNNPEKLAKAIIDLLSDEEKRKNMAARAHSFIFDTYNWDNVVRRVLDIYQRTGAGKLN